LCLHGFPDNASTFRHQLPALATAGYRAIALTLRGYEPRSIPPDQDYSVEAIVTDIVAVIDALGAAPIHLIGHDWGAAVAYRVAASAPDRLKSLTTLAVPHAGRFARDGLRIRKQLRLSWYMGFFNVPWVSDWVVGRNDFAFIRRLWAAWSPDWQPESGVLDEVIETLSQAGVKSAALGYYRAALSLKALTTSQEEAYYRVLTPTLALSGERDGCIDSAVFERLTVTEDFPEGVVFHRVMGAGHFLHQECPSEVNRLIIDWLVRHDEPPF
jgi:pimeloyl-ACP methyl ester carboxylesterase